MTQNTDFKFRVETLNKTLKPGIICYAAMLQDYGENNSYDRLVTSDLNVFKDPYKDDVLSDEEAQKRVVNNALRFNHFGIIEHVQIVMNCIGFPHDVVQQLRTHRTGVSFDVQSGRYSGKRICQVASKERDLEDVFFFRPVGQYKSREGVYAYTLEDRESDKAVSYMLAKLYSNYVSQGRAKEHARQVYTTYNLRQDFVLSGNLRSILHMTSVRGTEDVQLETRIWAQLVVEELYKWVPIIMDFYTDKFYGKNKLAP